MTCPTCGGYQPRPGQGSEWADRSSQMACICGTDPWHCPHADEHEPHWPAAYIQCELGSDPTLVVPCALCGAVGRRVLEVGDLVW